MAKRASWLILVGLGFVFLWFFVSAGSSALAPAWAAPAEHDGTPLLGDGTLLQPGQTTSLTDAALQQRLPPASAVAGDNLLPSAAIEPACPITMTGPVWWDTPPQSGSIFILPSGEQIIQPGPEDEVRIIIQLEDEPVAAYRSHLRAEVGRVGPEEREQINSYAEALRQKRQDLLSQIESEGIELRPRMEYDYLFNGMAATITMADMQRIRALPGVRDVYPDYEQHALLADSVPLIGADQVWAMLDAGGQPVTGLGIRVAVLDTGIDYTHPDLGGCFGAGCKVVGGYDFVNMDADPWDDHGHGTHCAGIIAANGVLKGVAPQASLYAYKVLNQFGSGANSGIIAALERAADPDGDPGTEDAVDIVSMSLGGAGTPDSALSLAVDAAVEQGIVVAVAAGNSGPTYQTVGSPGVARRAFTVGASDKSDALASFSSRGPVANYWELVKPDIVAPGVSISSTIPAAGYGAMSGTSMATPHIAGCAALIKQLHPSWTPAMIQANLMNTARDMGLNLYVQGAGRVQVDDAASAQAVLEPGSIGFGLVDVTQPLWNRSADLRLTNVSTTSLQYSLQVSGNLPVGVSTQLSPLSVTLGAGEGVTVTLAITVDNALTPYATQEPGSYEAQVVAQPVQQGQGTALMAGEPLAIPFAFIKSPQLRMTFDEQPALVLVHNGTQTWVSSYPGTSLILLIPPGTYDVWVIYNDLATWVIREGIVVSDTTDLTIRRSDAENTISLAPRDQAGEVISFPQRSLVQLFTYKPSNIWLSIVSRGAPLLTWHFSDVSGNYALDWRLDGAWNGAYYEFNDRVTGISADMTYQNNPADLWHIRHQCHPEPTHTQLNLSFHLPYG